MSSASETGATRRRPLPASGASGDNAALSGSARALEEASAAAPLLMSTNKMGGSTRVPASTGAEAGAGAEAKDADKDKGLEGDYVNIAILLLLYTLQGVPLGLSSTMDLILQEKKLSFDEQGVFSSVSWPYSLKVLWAPIVDSVFVSRFGRRKSWLVPIQLLIGVLLLATPARVTELLGADGEHPQVGQLTALFFVFYLLAATQDVALDGWAVEMLARRNIGYASTCNAVGQTFGFVLAFTGYLGAQMYGLTDLESFMRIWGAIFLVVTTAVALFKHEKSDKERLADGQDQQHSGEVPLSVAAAYRQMWLVFQLPGVRSLLAVLGTRAIAFAAADSLAQRKLIERGMKKEHVASLTVLITPLSIVLPGIISKQVSDRPLSLFKRAYLPRVVIGFFSLLLVLSAPDFAAHPDGIPPAFFAALVALVVCHSVLSTAMFVAMMGFFAQVSDPAIGGTYMTMLNTVANLGSKWVNQLVLFLVDHVTIRSCPEGEGDLVVKPEDCEVVLDGFVPISLMCIVAGFAWYHHYAPHLERLQDLDISHWRASTNNKVA